MIKISIVSVGKIKEKYIKLGIDEFSKRLSNYCKLEIIEVSDEKAPENLSDKEMTMVKNKEGLSILSKIKDGAYVIALAIDGKSMSSHIYLVIGGSLGLADIVLDRADMKLSFSKMTFPHQLMRLILLEQLYRAFRINSGQPYHK